MSAKVATINGGTDHATNAQQKSLTYVSPIWDINHLLTSNVLGYDDNLK